MKKGSISLKYPQCCIGTLSCLLYFAFGCFISFEWHCLMPAAFIWIMLHLFHISWKRFVFVCPLTINFIWSCTCINFLHAYYQTTFKGKVYMTHATKAIYRLLLSDYVKVSKVSVEDMLFDEQDILRSMDRIEVRSLNILQNGITFLFFDLASESFLWFKTESCYVIIIRTLCFVRGKDGIFFPFFLFFQIKKGFDLGQLIVSYLLPILIYRLQMMFSSSSVNPPCLIFGRR